jgi:hypothetical protein
LYTKRSSPACTFKHLVRPIQRTEFEFPAALVDISLEMRDVKPEYDNVPYAFIGCTRVLSLVEVKEKLLEAGIPEPALVEVIELLLWFGVLGIYVSEDEERYSYQCEHERKGAGPKNGKCRQRR